MTAPTSGAAPSVGTSISSVPSPKQVSVDKGAPQTPSPPKESTDFKGTKHKVKIGGQESEVEYDELVRGYQKARDSDKRYQEAARLAENAKMVDQALEAGDVNFLIKKMGPEKARAMMESYLLEQIKYEALPPHEKALREERTKREQLEAQIADGKKQQEQEAYQKMSEKAYQDLDSEIGEALAALGKKANPRLVLRMLDQFEARLKTKEERLPAKDALSHAMRGLREDIALITPDLSPSEIKELFGQDVIDRLMNDKVTQVLGGKQKTRNKASAPQVSDKPMTIEDKFKEIENKFKRR